MDKVKLFQYAIKSKGMPPEKHKDIPVCQLQIDTIKLYLKKNELEDEYQELILSDIFNMKNESKMSYYEAHWCIEIIDHVNNIIDKNF